MRFLIAPCFKLDPIYQMSKVRWEIQIFDFTNYTLFSSL